VVDMNVILWYIAPCSQYLKRRFGGTYHHLQGRNQPSKKPLPSHLLLWAKVNKSLCLRDEGVVDVGTLFISKN
jgi:hypothetical protein